MKDPTAPDVSFGRSLYKALGLYIAGACYGMPNGALFPMVTLTLSARGASDVFIGAVASAFSAGALLAAASYAAVVGWLGFRRAFTILVILGTASTAAFALPIASEWWLPLRFLYGFSVGSFYLTVDAWIGGLSRISNRGRMLGLSEAVRMASLSCGPLLLLLVAPGTTGFMLAAAMFGLMLPAGLMTAEPVAFESLGGRSTSLRFVLRHAAELAMVVSCGALFAMFSTHGASYAQRMGFSSDQVAYFNSGVYAAGAISLILLGAASDFLGRMVVLLGITTVGTLCGISLALHAAPGFMVALPLAAAVQAATMPLWSLSLARIIDKITAAELVTASSSGLIAYNVGAMAGPPAAGWLITRFGPQGLYISAAVALVPALLLALGLVMRTGSQARTTGHH